MPSAFVFLRQRTLQHSLFWLFFSLFYGIGYFASEQQRTWSHIASNYIGIMLIYVGYIYFNTLIIYRLLFERHLWLLGGALFVVILYLSTWANAFIFNYTNTKQQEVAFINFIPFFIFLAAMVLSIKIAKQSYLSLVREIEIKNSLLLQKDYFLRSQIHPHFLFNTLSNFYGLALERSELLPDFMLKLAHILRYQIEQSEEKQVSLENEFAYLRDYIELEKIRFSDNLLLDFSFPTLVPTSSFICPSILIIFIENAFKYAKNTSGKPIIIRGKIDIIQQTMYFELCNSIAQKSETIQRNRQMGLDNVKKRLAINYPNAHQLEIKQDGEYFFVSLKIDLNKLLDKYV